MAKGANSEEAEPRILLAGLPGNMATHMLHRLQEKDYRLASPHSGQTATALTGTHRKNKDGELVEMTSKFIDNYKERTGIRLVRPDIHNQTVESLKQQHGDNLYLINFANEEGYNVNFISAENNIPFITGITGAPEERESELVREVNNADIPAVIDKNMHPALVVFGAMLNYAQENFPGALENWGGIGTESHQSDKSDPMSGTLGKLAGYIRNLGVDFATRDGGRNIEAGHGDHYISLRSPNVDTRINLITEVTGRESYAIGTVDYALPFLIDRARRRETGVYDMIDVLGGQD